MLRLFRTRIFVPHAMRSARINDAFFKEDALATHHLKVYTGHRLVASFALPILGFDTICSSSSPVSVHDGCGASTSCSPGAFRDRRACGWLVTVLELRSWIV